MIKITRDAVFDSQQNGQFFTMADTFENFVTIRALHLVDKPMRRKELVERLVDIACTRPYRQHTNIKVSVSFLVTYMQKAGYIVPV